MAAQVNLQKCKTWGTAFQNARFPESLPPDSPLRKMTLVPWALGSGLKVLGVPVVHPDGGGDFAEHVWNQRVGAAVEAMEPYMDPSCEPMDAGRGGGAGLALLLVPP